MSCDQPLRLNDNPLIPWTVKHPVSGAAENATSQVIKFEKPDGTVVTYPGTPANPATGSYEIGDYALDQVGAWKVRIASTMAGGAKGSLVIPFMVREEL